MAQPFAALNAADATVISDDRHQEWLKFLRLIDDATPAEKELHLIADNYATSTPRCSDGWHGILGSHFTPTSSSWLNVVERFFRDLTEKWLRRGVFRDVEALIMVSPIFRKRRKMDRLIFAGPLSIEGNVTKISEMRQLCGGDTFDIPVRG